MNATKWLLSGILAGLIGLAAAASPFLHGPYCGAPARNSITISWSSVLPVPARVEYGLQAEFIASGLLRESVRLPAREGSSTVHVALKHLEPGTCYAYRVVLMDKDEELSSSVGCFHTAPEAGEPVRFAILADTQWQLQQANVLQWVGDAIASDPTPFDFILHAGDIVERPSDVYWDHWFASFGQMLLRAPFVPVLGNHEENDDSYFETFSLPPGEGKESEQWWALHWGDVVVIGLDTNARRGADIIAQQDWARNHLSGPEPHKFVIFHHPVYSSDSYRDTGTALEDTYHSIFVEHGVDIVLNGHSHHYERIACDGVTYLVLGGGGATPRRMQSEPIEQSKALSAGHFFYTRINVSSNRVRVETVSVAELLADGTVAQSSHSLDSFELPMETPEDSSPAAWIIFIAAIATGIVVFRLLDGLAD